MKTLDLKTAAQFLHMSPSALRQKAKLGSIKAAKPGKKWVFFESDLIIHIQSLFQTKADDQLIDFGKDLRWQSTKEEKRGGLISPRQMDKEYAALLGLKIASKPKSFMTK